MKLVDIENADVQFAIGLGISKRVEAKQLEEKAEVLRHEADELLAPLLSTIEGQKVESEGVGTVSIVTTTRSSFDKDKAKELLVLKGVPAQKVAEAFAKATTLGKPTESVRFTPVKVR